MSMMVVCVAQVFGLSKMTKDAAVLGRTDGMGVPEILVKIMLPYDLVLVQARHTESASPPPPDPRARCTPPIYLYASLCRTVAQCTLYSRVPRYPPCTADRCTAPTPSRVNCDPSTLQPT